MLDSGARPRRYLSLRSLLIADAAFELVCAAVLAGAAGAVSRWLGIDTAAAYVLAGVFVLAAAAVAYFARARRPGVAAARGLAIANVAGGLLGWAVLMWAWGSFDPPGRELLGSASDVLLALGVLELLAVRRLRSE